MFKALNETSSNLQQLDASSIFFLAVMLQKSRYMLI